MGRKYDAALKEAYTTITTADVATAQVLPALLGQAAGFADTAPLKAPDRSLFHASDAGRDRCRVSRKGRLLLIGTSNLEAQRPMIWDIGAIAESGHPKSLELVHQIILASASIPGAFPPMNISVTADGKSYNEMHVDGGVTRQVFLYPPSYDPRKVDRAIGWKAKRNLYIIRNNKISPEFAVVEPKVWRTSRVARSTRSSSSMASGTSFASTAIAQRDGIGYHFTSIPSDFMLESKSAFDKAYMGALFEAGYNAALQPEPWRHKPPGL